MPVNSASAIGKHHRAGDKKRHHTSRVRVQRRLPLGSLRVRTWRRFSAEQQRLARAVIIGDAAGRRRARRRALRDGMVAVGHARMGAHRPAGALQPQAPRRPAGHRLPLLPHGVEKSAYAGRPADGNVHDLPQPALHRSGHARARAPEPRGQQAHPVDARARPAGLRVLQPLDPRQQGHRLHGLPRAASTRCSSSGRTRRSTWRGACNATGTRKNTSPTARKCSDPQRVALKDEGKLDWAQQLVKDYHVQSSGVLTDCDTCHR